MSAQDTLPGDSSRAATRLHIPSVSLRETPACSICGRQDETLRIVVYPFVISLVIVTFRRAFAGLWCSAHRNQRLTFASLITVTLGWLGIPYGFLYTPVALLKLAQGGDQPAELNAEMLSVLAEHKLLSRDADSAVRCLEASLRFRDDDAVRGRLHEIRQKFNLPVPQGGCLRTLLALAGVLLGAAGIGALLGFMDYGITAILSFLMGGEEVLIYAVILSWVPFVVMTFIGGLFLFRLIEWALIRMRSRSLSFAIGVAIVAAGLAVYSLLEASAISDYLFALLSGGVFESASHAIRTGILVVLVGGFLWVLTYAELLSIADTIYLVLLLVVVVYYLVMAIQTAIQTARWQQRLVG